MMNWGKAITICIITFMLFILYMVFMASNTATDLFAPDYYEQEINYQDNITALQKGKDFSNLIKLELTNDSVKWKMPDKLIMAFDGEVHFYRPNNAQLDKHKIMQVNRGSTNGFSLSELLSGKYEVYFTWKSHNVDYRVVKTLIIP